MKATFFRFATVLSTCLFSVAFPSFSQAQESAQPSGWAVGVGAAVVRKPYAGDGTDTLPFPALTYDSERFRFAITTADWKVAKYGDFSFALRGRYGLGDGYSSSDAPILNGMNDRKAGFWVGGAVNWTPGFARFSGELLSDISGNSKGTQARFDVQHDFVAGSFVITPRLGVVYQNGNYVDYYYGVTQSEATIDRSAYQGTASVSYQGGVRTTYRLDSKQTLFLDVADTILGKEIKNSPLVDKSNVPSISVGYLYRF